MDNQRRRQIFQGAGFFWFLETSWYYVNPKGWREMVKFAQDFPSVWRSYQSAMTYDKKEPTDGS